MKFTCSQQNLLTAITTAQKLVSRNISPIYQYIYIEANDKNVKIASSGDEQTVITNVEAYVENCSKLLAPITVLHDIISKMPPVNINIETNDNYMMTLSYDRMKYTIQCIAADAFSFIDNINGKNSFSMNAGEFKKCVKQTYFTVFSEDTRPPLSGILIKCKDGIIDFVSTDTTRVSIRKIKTDIKNSFEITVPSKFLYEIIFSTNKFDADDIFITFNENYLMIKIGNITAITGLLKGKFINYESIIPQDSTAVMTCERSTLLSILERAFILSEETLYTVKLEIKYSKLYVSSSSASGEAYEEIPVKTNGIPITTAFNSKNFIEILRNTDYELLAFEFTTGTRICKIRPIETDDLLYLIMPIRL